MNLFETRRPRTGAGQMTRQEIIDLIHNEYDPAPRHYRPSDNWDDGSGRIADVIVQRIEALEAALKTYEAAIDEAEAIFGGEYADQYGPMFELAMKARDARRAALAPETEK